jgi:hypothetical protein
MAMKTSHVGGLVLALAGLFLSSHGAAQEKAGNNGQKVPQDFETFLKLSEDTARAFVNGNPAPANELMATDMPFALLGGAGGIETDATAIKPRLAGITRLYKGGTVTFDYAVKFVSGDIAYTVGTEHRVISIAGGEPQVSNLRVTQIYRRKNGQWKVVVRHADGAVDTVAPTVENFNRGNAAAKPAGKE